MQLLLPTKSIIQQIRDLGPVRSFLFHLFFATFVSGAIGFLPESVISGFYYNTYLEPYQPAILATAIIFGYFLNRKLGHSSARWVWIAGILWLAYGIHDDSRFWSSTWGGPNLHAYILNTLFAPSQKCGATECLGELLFTTPFAATVGYSIAAALGLRAHREIQVSAAKPGAASLGD